MPPAASISQLAEWIGDARQRTMELVADLTDEQMMGPRLAIVNPLWWEIGHVAWFQERWVLRRSPGLPSLRADADALYDSAQVPHDDRWSLPLPSRAETLDYLERVRDRVIDGLRAGAASEEDRYFNLLALFHEDMHTEAFTYTRQTLGYPAPRLVRVSGVGCRVSGTTVRYPTPDTRRPTPSPGPLPGDALVPGGTLMLGATPDQGFVFDNEKWAHPVPVRPFQIARAAVTNREFAAFVDAGGYRRREWWSEEGWSWREQSGAERPLYWQRDAAGSWLHREFDRLVPLEPHHPVLHVNWYEAEAFCGFAGRRLPTEAEWEMAAASEPAPDGRGIGERKRRYPWGDDPPTAAHANLDWGQERSDARGRSHARGGQGMAGGCVDVGALPASDSAFGCRQMIGNVWEWTSSPFLPYPGFVVDPYKEYSEPWFGTRKVLRGGCWATRSRLIRNTWRNFYTPDRRDVWGGFRTCAL